MIRPSLFSDIPRLCCLMEELHEKSRYSQYKLNFKLFKDLCMEAIRSGNNCLLVFERNGEVEGFILGVTDSLYHVLNVKYATDMYFYVSDRGTGGGRELIQGFIDWAKSIPNVVSIRMGATDAVVDYNRVAKLYEHAGLFQEGVMHEMRIEQ